MPIKLQVTFSFKVSANSFNISTNMATYRYGIFGNSTLQRFRCTHNRISLANVAEGFLDKLTMKFIQARLI